MIRVGMIGLGRITDVHYPAYRGSKIARLYAVCDANAELAEARRKQWKAEKAYTDYRELLSDPNVDAVEIITPHTLHEEMVIAAASAGKHIALQKPMTVSLESADRMLEAARAGGRVFRVTDNYVFYPPIALAGKMIRDGIIGEPSNIHIRFIGGGHGGWTIPASCWEWRIRENEAGGGTRGLQTFDHGHHLFSTAWFLLGGVERVSAWIDSIDGIVDSPSVVMWKHGSGKCYGTCEFAHAPELKIPSKYYANDEWMEITGSKGIIFIHRCTGNIHTGPAVSLFTSKGWKRYGKVKSDWGESFIEAGKNYFNAIMGNEAPMLNGDDAREVMRFSLAVQRSARVRREVYLDDMDARFPVFNAWIRRRRELGKKNVSIFSRIFGGGFGKASDAAGLTRKLLDCADSALIGDWKCVFGIHLTPARGAGESFFSVTVGNGALSYTEGSLPPESVFLIRVPADVWGGVMKKQTRIETAFIQGDLKIEGKPEEALTLRTVLGL